MNRQATALREYIRRNHSGGGFPASRVTQSTNTRVITFAGGKGGVGKTILGLLVGLNSKLKTLIVDGDYEMAGLSTMMEHSADKSWMKYMAGRADLSDGLMSLNERTDLFRASQGAKDAVVSPRYWNTRFNELMHRWRDQYELILLDTASGLGPHVLDACLVSDSVVLVSTPDPVSCADTYALIKVLALADITVEIHILFNQVFPEDDPQELFRNLDGLVQKFLGQDIRFLAAIPWEQEMAKAARSRQTLLETADDPSIRSKITTLIQPILETTQTTPITNDTTGVLS